MTERPNFKKVSVHEGPKQSPGFLLWHVSTSWRSAIETVLKAFGLTHPQFVVLATTGWLTRNGELATQAAIGRMAGLDPNTTSQVISGLEKKALIKREASSDGRAKNPRLTSRGNELLTQALPAVEEEDDQFFNVLSPLELKKLVLVFEKIMN
ncbi:MAG TPA: MarR family transcriptional regulator [Parachlamydiaceae bacterium]|nr:MarR family transcriptional regulator [Parachlamydiaceae bacterium]